MSYVIWKRALVVLACLVLACSLVALMPGSKKAEAQEIKNFTILHTNDIHSELIPYGPASDYPTYPTTGGFARLANAIGGIKLAKAGAGEPVLTLDAGDFTQGTLFSALESQPVAGMPPELVLLKNMGYDALALGNHEFDLTTTFLAGELNIAKNISGIVGLPILCTNINVPAADPLNAWLSPLDAAGFRGDTVAPDLKIQNYTVKTLPNGLKVGIFGLMGVEAEYISNAKPVTFGNIISGTTLDTTGSFAYRLVKAQQTINHLRTNLGCQVVICLSHSGWSQSGTSEEANLAQFLSGLDVLVGGHSHSLVYPPKVYDPGKTIYVQAGAYGAYLGELELQYDPSKTVGKVSVRNGTAIPINQTVSENAVVKATVDAYKAGLDAAFGMNILNRVVETDLFGNGGFNLYNYPDFCETNLGDLVTDAYKTIGSAYVAPSPDPTPIQIAIEGNGNIRADIPKGGLGRFSFYDVNHVVPLGGSSTDLSKPGYSLLSFYLAGQELMAALNVILDLGKNDFFVQVSGLKFTYNPTGPPFNTTNLTGGKLVSCKVQGAGGAWVPINPAALYRVTMNYYNAKVMQDGFGIKPRDRFGAQQTVDFAAFKLYDAGMKELRCWEALFGYLTQVMTDLDGDGMRNVAPIYAANQGRIQALGTYLAEGSTAGGMEDWIVVQNPGTTDARVNLKFHTNNGEWNPAQLQGVTIPAKSRMSFNVGSYYSTFDVSAKVEVLSGNVVSERAMYGNSKAWGTDSIGTPTPAAAWYLAEGSTAGGMETYVVVQNPSGTDVRVNVKFHTENGEQAPAALQGTTVPAKSRKTYKINDYVPNSYNVSTLVEALKGGVVCERAVYGNSMTWGTDSIGATAPAATWYMAEGSTAGGMQTYVVVQNPFAADAKVNIKFHTDTGEQAPAALQGVTIPAKSRRTFKVNDYVPNNYNVSTLVEAQGAGSVVCERAMYGNNMAWGTDSVGVNAPRDTWYMAEGCTSAGMQTYVVVQNPTAANVKVNVKFNTDSGEQAPAALQGVTIPAKSRRTFKVNDFVTSFNVSTLVEGVDGYVVCERAMYGNNMAWSTESIGFAPIP